VTALAFVGEESFQGHAQKGAESSALGFDAFEIVFLQEAGKESLRHILRVHGVAS
jgi:hypothetical protein